MIPTTQHLKTAKLRREDENSSGHWGRRVDQEAAHRGCLGQRKHSDTVWWTSHYCTHVSKPKECAPPRVNPSVSSGLWGVMGVSVGSVIVTKEQDVDNGRGQQMCLTLPGEPTRTQVHEDITRHHQSTGMVTFSRSSLHGIPVSCPLCRDILWRLSPSAFSPPNSWSSYTTHSNEQTEKQTTKIPPGGGRQDITMNSVSTDLSSLSSCSRSMHWKHRWCRKGEMQKQNDEALSFWGKKNEEIRTKAKEKKDQKLSTWKKKRKVNEKRQIKAVYGVIRAQEKQGPGSPSFHRPCP